MLNFGETTADEDFISFLNLDVGVFTMCYCLSKLELSIICWPSRLFTFERENCDCCFPLGDGSYSFIIRTGRAAY